MLLKGIKEIAAYMRTSTRSISRWEKQHQFPMCFDIQGHRIITTSLIDQWLLARRNQIIVAREQAKARLAA